jgi:hypothetical protein
MIKHNTYRRQKHKTCRTKKHKTCRTKKHKTTYRTKKHKTYRTKKHKTQRGGSSPHKRRRLDDTVLTELVVGADDVGVGADEVSNDSVKETVIGDEDVLNEQQLFNRVFNFDSEDDESDLEDDESDIKETYLEFDDEEDDYFEDDVEYNVTIAEPHQYIITDMQKQLFKASLFKIEYVNTDHENCVTYFLVNNKKVNFKLLFLQTEHDGNILVKRDNTLDEPTVLNILSYIKTSKLKGNHSFLKTNNIYYLNYLNCKKEIDLTDANMKIAEFNSLLNIKCDNLSLSLNYIYNSPTNSKISMFDNRNINYLMLCLNNDYGCISSITFEFHKDIPMLTLSSQTKSKFEGKKYNKFLRAVTILICPLLQIQYIGSYAVNPISAYLLMTHFNALPDQDFMRSMRKFLKKNAEIPLLEFIKKYQQPISLTIDTYDATTAQKAQAVINELLGEHIEKNIICN